MGSEFSFEDIAAQTLDKYVYKYLKEKACTNKPTIKCDVVELNPQSSNSGYSKQITEFDQSTYQIQTIAYYDKTNHKFKTLTLNDYKQYKNKFWRAQKLVMKNHLTDKSTEINFSSFKFGLGLNYKIFSKKSLSRLR